MKHIPQRYDTGDCGVASLAMFLDQSYEDIMQSVPPDVVPYGLWIYEKLHVIKKRANIDALWVSYTAPLIQLSRYEIPKEPWILGIMRIEHDYAFHYVYSDGVYFHDPLLPNKITVEQAKTDYHSGWLIYCLIKNP